MKKSMSKFFVLVALLTLSALVLAACGAKEEAGPETMGMETQAEEHAEGAPAEEHDEGGPAEEHDEGAAPEEGDHGHAELPDEFAGMSNPLAGDAAAAAAGEQIYQAFCAACHGAQGAGDGPAAASLNPKPTDLTDPTIMGQMDDNYLYWRISEGGAMAPFNSSMPAWKDTLEEEQIWQVIVYLRTLER